MPNLSRRYRQYAGLALVIAVYLGGIGGWSCAVTNLERASAPAPAPPSSFYLQSSDLQSSPPRTHVSSARPNIPHRSGYLPRSLGPRTVWNDGSLLAGGAPKGYNGKGYNGHAW